MQSLRDLFAITIAIILSACSTPIPSPQSSWKQATGQIQSRGGTTPIVGEIAIRYDDDHFLAEITKGPSLPLLKIYAQGAHPAEVVVRGALARGSWKGAPANAPAALQAWVALPEVFHWAVAQKDRNPFFTITLPGLKTAGSRDGDALSRFEYTRGGEQVVVRLQP
jgi:hypothetical protein